jgi:putative membrane protein
MAGNPPFGERVAWEPAKPRFRPVQLVFSWLLSAAALFVSAWIVPGIEVRGFGGAVIAALLIAVLNAVLPPIVAALRLPLMAALGFLLVLVLDAAMLLLASKVAPSAIKVSSPWWAR